ncbi:hypothetical protein [Bradyrhizobium elkanii]|uniref:hypothetical protein n=1 Tax=Bradyrhizobium elkanii TaxID=29448 RepID=UPI002169F09B|nr:hypothetical protein [Bradyrhizobium elkanii]MCS3523834.1 hypothetical protein [Bradyrhizobium elkanii]MCS4071489.1 hypothetical protein [Bradyrhizobium elkanii]MCS4078121.1 hypothetical protein [Bradyrhizobium elkanii]MCW2123293.1 hypothetical protein [Bradyrhizobium elkanii]MCW2170040.1 hypothetical protein [Bradyrhizobium elkanii]
MALETKIPDQVADGRMARSRSRMPTWLRWTLIAVFALGICAAGALFGQHAQPWIGQMALL